MIVMHCRTVNAITRRYNSPPLGIACFIEAINPLVLIVAVGINTILLQTSNCNPMLFCFWIEVGVKGTIVRHIHIAVASRHDLNHIGALHGVISCVNEITSAFLRALAEKEVFIFRFGRCINRKRNFACVVHAEIRTERIVDHTTALFTIGSNQIICNSLPGSVEVVVVLIETIVRIIGTTSIANVKIRTPRDAMEFRTVTIGTDSAQNVRTVRIVQLANPVTVGLKGFAFFVVAIPKSVTYARCTCLVTITRRTVIAGRVGSMETIAGQFWMLLQQSTRVHHAEGDALAVIAKRVCLRGTHGRQAPVFFVLTRFPRINSVGQIFGTRSYESRFNISSRSSRGTESGGNSNSNSNNSTLGGFAVGLLSFIRHDEAATNVVPQRFESLIHEIMSFRGVFFFQQRKSSQLLTE